MSKDLYLLGNWKSNKTIAQAREWKAVFDTILPEISENHTVIVVPAFHHLPVFLPNDTHYVLGVQDISPYASGAFTGAIAADLVKDDIRFAMIGHSERRKHFAETDEIVAEKVRRALESGIRPVVCVSETIQVSRLAALVPEYGETGMLLYEPLFAVGSGTADTPENADEVAGEMRKILPVPVLYGGSVVPENVQSFIRMDHLSGVGVGGASLKPDTFASLVGHATA